MIELNEENYFSQENELKYCGSSQLKSFNECEAKAMAKLKGEWTDESTISLMMGSYLDAAVSDTLYIFKDQHPEIFKRDGTLKAEYVKAEKAFERIKRDSLFMKYVSGNHQTIMTGKIADVPIKIKIDSYFPGKAIVDLKFVKDFEKTYNPKTQVKENFIDYWKYTWQAAFYQEIVRQNIGETLPFFIAAVTKEDEPNLGVFAIPNEVLDETLEIVKDKLIRVKGIKEGIIYPERCECCNYCRNTKILTQIIDYRDM